MSVGASKTNQDLISQPQTPPALPLIPAYFKDPEFYLKERYPDAGVRVLGAGGWGTVYSTDFDGRPVAVKVSRVEVGDPPAHHPNDSFQLSILKEVAVASLGLPRVPELVDYDLRPGRPWSILTPLIEGNRLAVFLKPSMWSTPDFQTLGNLLIQIAETIKFAHRHDVIHLDLKAENILVSTSGAPYVLDWGACWLPVSLLQPVWSQFGLEEHFCGVLINNPQPLCCAAPELLCPGITPTPAADVFALGLLLYKMVYKKQFLFDLTMSNKEEFTEALRTYRIDEVLPEDGTPLNALLRLALNRDPQARCTTEKFHCCLSEIVNNKNY